MGHCWLGKGRVSRHSSFGCTDSPVCGVPMVTHLSGDPPKALSIRSSGMAAGLENSLSRAGLADDVFSLRGFLGGDPTCRVNNAVHHVGWEDRSHGIVQSCCCCCSFFVIFVSL